MASKKKPTATNVVGKAELTPMLRFPEFRKADKWKQMLIESVCTSFSGGTPSTSQKEYYGGDIPFIRSAEIDRDKTELFLTEQGLNNSAAKLVSKGDVLVALYGANSGDIAVAKINGAINQAILCLKSISSNTFIYHYLSHRKNWVIATYLQGGQGNLSGDIVKSISLGFPELPEQHKIAACLSSLDNLIAEQGRKIDSLKTHKKGLMQQLFPREGETQPRLRFPEFRDAGAWEIKTVGDVFQVTRGEVLSMTLVTNKASTESPFPVYSSQTKNNGLAGFYSDFLYEDAITWTTDGANAGDVNYRPGPFYCTNVCGVLINTNGQANACVAALLNSVSRKHVSYVGNPKLMNGVMAKIEIPFPELPEQKRIADCLISVDDLISSETQKLDALKTHKKGLMQQLFPSPTDTD
jgi:type I restriction enzyme S subunit